MPPVLPLKDSARARIQELVRVLEPHFPEITTAWRVRMFEELGLDGRVMSALERLNLGTGLGLCCKSDFSQFAENLRYYGTRLAKLNVDTRAVARALELYQSFCEPYLERALAHGACRGDFRAGNLQLDDLRFHRRDVF